MTVGGLIEAGVAGGAAEKDTLGTYSKKTQCQAEYLMMFFKRKNKAFFSLLKKKKYHIEMNSPVLRYNYVNTYFNRRFLILS